MISDIQIAQVIRKEAEACLKSSKLNSSPMNDIFHGCHIVLTSLADRFDETGLHAPKKEKLNE